MLVLGRNVDEAITLILPEGRQIQIIIVRGCDVRIGIEAPKDILIIRTEKMAAT